MSALNAAQAFAALEPVRREVLRQAGAEADQHLADAHGDAQRILTDARAQAAQLTEAARSAGQAAASALAAQRRAALARSLRGEVLAAQRDFYQQWRRCGREAVLRLRDDPDYPRWAAALRAAATTALGPAAQINEPADGGVVAQTADERVDLSLGGIAGRALDATAPQVGELWS